MSSGVTPEYYMQSADAAVEAAFAGATDVRIGGDPGWEIDLVLSYTQFTREEVERMSATQIADILLEADDAARDEALASEATMPQPQAEVITVPTSALAPEADIDEPAFEYPNKDKKGEWRVRAYCVNTDPEIPFNHEIEGIDEETKRRAAIISRLQCLHCVVKVECYTEAVETKKFDGMYGGLTQSERKDLSDRKTPIHDDIKLAEIIGRKLRLDQNYVKRTEKARLKAEHELANNNIVPALGLQQIS